MDTDAAGIWHHSVMARWAEEAETELHRRLGIIDETFGATPRVHIEFDFGTPLHFEDVVDITLTVAELGETSVTYQIEAHRDGALTASGRVVAVHIDRTSGQRTPWPDHIRQALRNPVSRES